MTQAYLFVDGSAVLYTPRGASTVVVVARGGASEYSMMYRMYCRGASLVPLQSGTRKRYQAKAKAYYLAWREAIKGTCTITRKRSVASQQETE